MKKMFIHICTAFIWNKEKRKSFRNKHLGKRKVLRPPFHVDEHENLVWDQFLFASNNQPLHLPNNVHFLFRNIVYANTVIGRYSYIGEYTKIDKCVRIGRYCSIAANVTIGATIHPTNWLSTSPFQYDLWLDPETQKKQWITAKATNIGNDVWIGANAVIQSGISVGDGAIIGSAAVVTHDVPPYAIVAGVPARILRYRFEPDIVKALLKIKWWNLKHEKIRTLPFSDVSQIIEELR